MRVTPIDKLAAAALSSLLVANWYFWQPDDPLQEQSIVPNLPEIPKETWNAGSRLPVLSVYSEITRRPLFTETRRPAVLTRTQTKDESDLIAKRIRVQAIVITSEERKALVNDRIEKKQFYVEIDSIIQGWCVHDIRPDGVLVERGVQASFLTLSPSPKGSE